jgi:TPR repeat protein
MHPSFEQLACNEQAAEYWMKAAENGHAESQNNLAVCYFYGRGVDKDVAKAVHWWKVGYFLLLSDATIA